MKTARATDDRPIRRIGDATGFHAGTDWCMAALLLGAAAACVFYFKLTFNFDFNAPDFNPAVGVPVFLGAFGLGYLVSAVRGTMLGRRFGESVLEMEGESIPLGGTLKGRIRTHAELTPRADYVITLRCIEQIRTTSRLDVTKSRTTDHIRWEATRRVEAGSVNSQTGIPFKFIIPETAYAMPDSRAKGDIRWTLEITAPLPGLDYHALFGVIVRAKGG